MYRRSIDLYSQSPRTSGRDIDLYIRTLQMYIPVFYPLGRGIRVYSFSSALYIRLLALYILL